MNDSNLSKAPPPVAKNSTVTALLLAAACVGLMTAQARAGTIYNEATSSPGDTSDNFSSPTLLPPGTDFFIGTVGGTIDHTDAFVFQLPNNGSPTLLNITYTFSSILNVDSLDLEFFTSAGVPLAGRINTAGLSGSLSITIPASQSLKVVAFSEGGPQTYTVGIAPLPNSAALGSAGLLGLGAAALLGKRGKSTPAYVAHLPVHLPIAKETKS